jgi:ADP-heptose:LPS heptosyltransferase
VADDRPDDPRPTVLVLRALQIGDLLVAVPALRAVRRAHPEHRLVLATSAALALIVERIGGVDLLLPTPDPTAVPWPGATPNVAVNLHGTGPQSHRALNALNSRRRIGFRCGDAGPGWEGPAWDTVAVAHPHERARWCALLEAVGIPADADDLRLPSPACAGSTDTGSARAAPVLVHPGAAYGAKRWPVERFAAVALTTDSVPSPAPLRPRPGRRPPRRATGGPRPPAAPTSALCDSFRLLVDEFNWFRHLHERGLLGTASSPSRPARD